MPSDDKYTLWHEWIGPLFYMEATGRSVCFDASDEPLEAYVPTPAQWREWAPEWAHERRDIILQRLRDSGYCIIEAQFQKIFVIPAPPLPMPRRKLDAAILCLELVLIAVGLGLASVLLIKALESDFWLVMFFCALVYFSSVVLFLEWVRRRMKVVLPHPAPWFRWERVEDRRDDRNETPDATPRSDAQTAPNL